jgi:hypothetical protein
MPAVVICFKSFRLERDRRREREREDSSGVAPSPFGDRLASVMLTCRQIAHRRAMLDFGNQRRRTTATVFREVATERE